MSELKEVLERNKKTHKNGKLWKRLMAVAGVILVAIGAYYFFVARNEAGSYEMVKVKRQDIKESVEITGNVEAGATIKLGFRQSGQLAKINFITGDAVKKDDIIAELESSNQKLNVDRARAYLSGAQANLNRQLAGNTKEIIEIAEAGVSKMIAALDKVNQDLVNAKEEYDLTVKKFVEDFKRQQLVVDDAKVKYDYALTNAGNTSSTSEQTVINASNSLKAQLFSSSNQIQQALLDIKSVAIDSNNSLLGSDFYRLDNFTWNSTKDRYFEVKNVFDPFYQNLKTKINFTDDELLADAGKLEELINKMLGMIKLLTDSLAQMIASATLSQVQLDSIKNMLFMDSGSLSSSSSLLISTKQALLNARLGLTSSSDTSQSAAANAKNYYDQQLQALASLKIDQEVALNTKNTTIENLESQLKIQEADLRSAQANLSEIKAPPRSVDIANLRTQVSAAKIDLQLAEADLDKTLLKAPMDGVLTRKNIEEGEQYTFLVSQDFVPVFEMIAASRFKIDANIAEVDIGKIKIGDKVKIGLDALPGQEFAGTIFNIDPVETKIQDVVYYKAEVMFDEQNEQIKPGMSADVDIVLSEASQAITVPDRAIIREDGDSFARVLEKNQVKQIKVVTGIRSLSGDLEIKEGLFEGQEIILRSK